MTSFMDKAKETANELAEKAGPLAQQAKERATELAGQAREKAGPLAEQAREKAGPLAEQARGAAATGVGKLAEALNKATSGRYSDKIDSASGKLGQLLDPEKPSAGVQDVIDPTVAPEPNPPIATEPPTATTESGPDN
jgi:uncharacterized protein YidB (DUF937 family)